MEDFYKVLGVNENASQDEIKKAYRKLAVEHHPDKGGDENTFKKISEAYDTIGDENKRSQYNNQRSNPFSGGVGFDPFGNGFNPFGDMFNMHQQRKRAVPDKIVEVVVGAVESFKADDKAINYSRNHKCGGCNGEGGEKITCSTCGGAGSILVNPCFVCAGTGTKDEIKSVEIKIPHGLDDGQFLRLQSMGDFRNGIYGDLILRIQLDKEDNFIKYGNNLVYDAFFDLDDLKKESFEIQHPDGPLTVKFPKQFDSSKPLRVKSKGFKLDTIGDLLINQFVKFHRD